MSIDQAEIITITQNGIIYELKLTDGTASVIGNNDFFDDIVIPKSIKCQKQDFIVKSINQRAFANSRIRSIQFPFDSQVSVIEKDAFRDSSIQNIVLPSSISDLKEGWCCSTASLTNFSIMPTNPIYINFDNTLILSNHHSKRNEYSSIVFATRNIKNVTIPSFISCIEPYAFSECLIEKVFISSSINQICEGSFYNCVHLQHVEIPPDSKLLFISNLAFSGTSIETIIIPSTVHFLCKGWCDDNTKVIKKDYYIQCKSLTTVRTNDESNQNGEYLYFQKKNGKFSNAVLKSNHQHKRIEIVPKDKESFTLSDFIKFAFVTFPEFITAPIEKSNNDQFSISLTAYPNPNGCYKINDIPKLKGRNYSFRVEIDKDFNNIHVYVKDYLNYFVNDKNMILLENKTFGYEIFEKIRCNQDNYAMLTVFGKYVSNALVKCPVFLKYTFSKFQSDRTQRYKSKFAKTDNIIKMLRSVPGKILFRYQEAGKGGYTFKNSDGKIYAVNSFAWIFPWAKEIIEKVHYSQIDGSFKAFPDYSFCIWHGIFNNETIPYALTLYPTEDKQLYEILFDCLKFYKIDEELFQGRLILADMGDSIDSFCKKHNLAKFVCHRHLIENFGANSPLGIIVTRLLKAKNEGEYIQLSNEISVELKFYEKFKSLYSNIDENTEKNIKKLKIMIAGVNGDSSSNYYVYKWARWLRADFHMNRCSNHAEGTHGNINSSMSHQGASNFSSGLSATINYILNLFQNRQKNHGSSFGKHHLHLRRKIIQFLSNCTESDLEKCNNECKCEEEFYNSAIYGVNFPCHHKLIALVYSSEEFKDFKNSNSVNVDKFIIDFLQKPINYSKDFSNEDIQKKCDELIDDYKSFKQIDLEKKSTFSFVQHLLLTLSYKLPKMLEFDENYLENSFHDEQASQIEIKVNQKNRNKKHFNKVICDDLHFWIRNCTNEIQRILKTKYYQTVNEILFMYKDIKERAYSICNDNYEKYLTEIYFQSEEIIAKGEESEMPNILNKMATFKMSCWLDADRCMNDHKFI